MSQNPRGVFGSESSGERQSDELEVIFHEKWIENEPTGPGLLPEYSNPKGTRYIALGGEDSTGAVKIVPIKRQGNALPFYRVSARQPFVGFIEGPWRVEPFVKNETVDTTGFLIAKCDLDVRAFERVPFEPVRRGPLFYQHMLIAPTEEEEIPNPDYDPEDEGSPPTITIPEGPPVDEPWINIRGRARTALSLFCNANKNEADFLLQFAHVGDGDDDQLNICSADILQVKGCFFYEFQTLFTPQGLDITHIADAMDYMRVISLTPGFDDYSLIVQAWDE